MNKPEWPDRWAKPGSPDAVAGGCLCPVIDNHYGAGRPEKDGPNYIVDVECPLHGPAVLAHVSKARMEP